MKKKAMGHQGVFGGVFGLILIIACFFPGTARSEMIEGQVTALDPFQKSIGVVRTNPDTNAEEILNVSVSDGTKYGGMGSLSELKFGDDVLIEGQRNNFTQAWEAHSVKKS